MPEHIDGYHVYQNGPNRVEVKANSESWIFEVNYDEDVSDENKVEFVTYYEEGEEKPCSNYHKQEEIVRKSSAVD